MRRALKIIASLLMLVVLAVATAMALLPTERIAEIAAERVEAATGRRLTLSGDLSPSFWPVLGVETGAVSLGNAEWGEAPALVSAERVRIGVAIAPLLQGEISVSEITLVKPVISLEISEDGAANWDFGGASGEAAGGGGPGGPKSLSIDDFTIEDGALRYADHRSGALFELSDIDTEAALPALEGELTLAGSALWRDEKATLDLTLSTPGALLRGAETTLRLDIASKPASLSYDGVISLASGRAPIAAGLFKLTSEAPGEATAFLTGAPAPAALAELSALKLDGSIVLGDAAKVALTGSARRGEETTELSLTAEGGPEWKARRLLSVKAEIKAGDLLRLAYEGEVAPGVGSAPVTLNGGYDIAASNPAAAARWLAGAAPAALDGLSRFNLNGKIDLSASGLGATVKGGFARGERRAFFDIAAKGGEAWAKDRAFALTANATFDGLATFAFKGDAAAPEGAPPRATGEIDLNATDLRGLAALLGAPLPEGAAGAYRTLRLAGALSTPGAERFRIAGAAITLDDIAASGDLDLTLGGRPVLAAALRTGDLDLTPYLGDGGEGGGEGETGWSREPIDLSALDAFDAALKLRAKSVTLPKIKLGRSDIDATLKNGRLDLNISELALYGGGVKGAIRLDGTKGAALSADIAASAVRLLPALRALADMRSLEGLGEVNLKVQGAGASLDAIMRSLDGEGAMKLSDGAIVGYNLAAMARNVANAFTGGGGARKTDFSEISASFTIADGKLSNSDFAFLGPLIRATGAGEIDLAAQTMNFRLVPKAVATLKGQGGKLDRSGLSFPVVISGPWSNLSFQPDLKAGIEAVLADPDAAAGAVQDILKGGGEDALGTIQDALGGGDPALGAALEGLNQALGGAKKTPEAAPQPKPRPSRAEGERNQRRDEAGAGQNDERRNRRRQNRQERPKPITPDEAINQILQNLAPK